jgi:phenylalanine-4-hydroxylase
MLFCAEHREYLRQIAKIAVRATPNALDSAFHEAVRYSAELKSRPDASRSDIERADTRLAQIYAEMREDASEVTCLRRLYTWSIEFGLFGSNDELVIHGAALLSAPAELRRVATGRAPLAPFSLDVIHQENAFSDLLERYFVAKDYAELHDVLGTFAASMSHPTTSDVRELRSGAFEIARKHHA